MSSAATPAAAGGGDAAPAPRRESTSGERVRVKLYGQWLSVTRDSAAYEVVRSKCGSVSETNFVPPVSDCWVPEEMVVVEEDDDDDDGPAVLLDDGAGEAMAAPATPVVHAAARSPAEDGKSPNEPPAPAPRVRRESVDVATARRGYEELVVRMMSSMASGNAGTVSLAPSDARRVASMHEELLKLQVRCDNLMTINQRLSDEVKDCNGKMRDVFIKYTNEHSLRRHLEKRVKLLSERAGEASDGLMDDLLDDSDAEDDERAIFSALSAVVEGTPVPQAPSSAPTARRRNSVGNGKRRNSLTGSTPTVAVAAATAAALGGGGSDSGSMAGGKPRTVSKPRRRSSVDPDVPKQCSHCNANATSRWVPGHMQYEGGLVCNACDHIYRHQHTYPTPEQVAARGPYNRKQRRSDTWVQCSSCAKWRRLPTSIKLKNLPEKWLCEMNTWDDKRACSVAQEEESQSGSSRPGGQAASARRAQGRASGAKASPRPPPNPSPALSATAVGGARGRTPPTGRRRTESPVATVATAADAMGALAPPAKRLATEAVETVQAASSVAAALASAATAQAADNAAAHSLLASAASSSTSPDDPPRSLTIKDSGKNVVARPSEGKETQRSCAHCGTANDSVWRSGRGELHGKTVCRSCGVYHDRHSTYPPDEIIAKRKRRRSLEGTNKRRRSSAAEDEVVAAATAMSRA